MHFLEKSLFFFNANSNRTLELLRIFLIVSSSSLYHSCSSSAYLLYPHLTSPFPPVSSLPGHSGECQDNKAGKSAKLGETWTTTGCKLATCVLRDDPLTGEMTLTITEDG